MAAAPTFSIVLPTRNRAKLLTESALPSILAQTSRDYEVVVCDNASTDDTPSAVAQFARRHPGMVKYYRTETWIPKEKFFQWSMEMAIGRYITLFFDDDVLCRRAIEKAAAAVAATDGDVISYSRSLVYFYPDYPVEARANVLIIPEYTGELHKFDSRQHMDSIYLKNDILLATPMVSNAFYKATLVRDLISRYGELYLHGHMGDYNTAVFMLANTKHFYYLDDPIALFGHWSQNTSAQLHDLKTTMPEYAEWIDWITTNHLSGMPVKQYIWPNCVAAAMNDTAKRVGVDIQVDIPTYFRTMLEEIARLSGEQELADRLRLLEAEVLSVAGASLGAGAANAIRDVSKVPPWRLMGLGKVEGFSNPLSGRVDNSRGYAVRDPAHINSIQTALTFFEQLTAPQ